MSLSCFQIRFTMAAKRRLYHPQAAYLNAKFKIPSSIVYTEKLCSTFKYVKYLPREKEISILLIAQCFDPFG